MHRRAFLLKSMTTLMLGYLVPAGQSAGAHTANEIDDLSAIVRALLKPGLQIVSIGEL